MNIRIFTLVMVEDEEGKQTLSFDGNMPLKEVINNCQNILLKMAQQEAIEEYKKGIGNGDNM